MTDVDQVVQLQQVDVIDAQALERAVEPLFRALVVACVRFGGDEERARVSREPWCDPQLGVAVRGGGVDVIHTVLEKQLQRSLCVRVGYVAERRRTEDGSGALVAGAAEWRLRDQRASLPLPASRPSGWPKAAVTPSASDARNPGLCSPVMSIARRTAPTTGGSRSGWSRTS